MGSVPLVASLADTRNLATCLFFGGCLILTYKAFSDFEVSLSETPHATNISTAYINTLYYPRYAIENVRERRSASRNTA